MDKLIMFIILTVVGSIHCQDRDELIFFSLKSISNRQQNLLDKLNEISQDLENMRGSVMSNQDSLETMHTKIALLEEKNQESAGVLSSLTSKTSEISQDLANLKGSVRSNQDSLEKVGTEIGQCLKGDDLHHFENISTAGRQKMESFIQEKIDEIVSLSQTDECALGIYECEPTATCEDSLLGYKCSCAPGLKWNGTDCEDIDECEKGIAECSSGAKCANTVGGYRCYCDPGFRWNGNHCEELQCESPSMFIQGLGCVRHIKESKSWQAMKIHCESLGGQLLEGFKKEHFDQINEADGKKYGGWVGVYKKEWLQKGTVVDDELWNERSYNPDTAQCGLLEWLGHPQSGISQFDCSNKYVGYCQFLD